MVGSRVLRKLDEVLVIASIMLPVQRGTYALLVGGAAVPEALAEPAVSPAAVSGIQDQGVVTAPGMVVGAAAEARALTVGEAPALEAQPPVGLASRGGSVVLKRVALLAPLMRSATEALSLS